MQVPLVRYTTDPQIYFPIELSNKLIEAFFEPTQPSWHQYERFLDEIVPLLVAFGYARIPGIRKTMEAHHVSPGDIVDFASYEAIFPEISLHDIHAVGKEQFELNCNEHVNYLSRQYSQQCILFLKAYLEDTKRAKSNIQLPVTFTQADYNASALALSAHLRWHANKTQDILINQNITDNKAGYILQKIIMPALSLNGIRYHLINGAKNFKKLSKKTQTVFWPGSQYQAADLDMRVFEQVFCVNEAPAGIDSLYLGNFEKCYGLFPNICHRLPIPYFFRQVDENGRTFRSPSQSPDFKMRGRLMIDRFFSAYEQPSSLALLRKALQIIIDQCYATGIKTISPLQYWEENLGSDFLFRADYLKIAAMAEKNGDEQFTLPDLRKLLNTVLVAYFKTSIRLGIPAGTWLLKIALPVGCNFDSHGCIHNSIALMPGKKGYITGKEWDVKYPPEQTPYTDYSLVAVSPGKEKTGYISTLPCAVRKRITNALNGKKTIGPENGFLLSAGIASPLDFYAILESAEKISQRAMTDAGPTLDDILYIIARLQESIEAELSLMQEGKPSMIKIFVEKTRIPLSEVKRLIHRAREDFVSDNGLGVKKLIFAAFIDPEADINSLTKEDFDRGVQAISGFKVKSPAFMVTPGNITLYDSVFLFANILLVCLADQTEKKFTMYIRPSESDITFNFLVYKYIDIAREIDPDNKKGLRNLFQKAYWDPRYDKDFLVKAMSKAAVGIYYGTAKTYTRARFEAALMAAERLNIGTRSTREALLSIASRKPIDFQAIDPDFAGAKGLDGSLVGYVNDFLKDHFIFPETLNANIVHSYSGNIEQCATSILEQTINLRGADCTNVSKLWLHRSQYNQFMTAFREKAQRLTCGDVLNSRTRLAQYDTDFLKGTESIVSSREDTDFITPLDANTGEKLKNAIVPSKNITGVIVTEIEVESLLGGEPLDRDTLLKHLAGEVPLPWLNVVIYDYNEQLYESMTRVLEKYRQRSGYPRYLYIGIMGNSDSQLVNHFRESKMTDLIKTGAEADRQFNYYRPHQGNFFVRALLS